MTRDEHRRLLERVATQRRVIVICVTLAAWEEAVRDALPLCSAATQREARALQASMQRGPCAECGVVVIWGRATPHEPLKVCEPCADARRRIEGGDVLRLTDRFDDPPSEEV